MATLLRLELDRLKALAKTEEERRWLEEKAVPKVPTSRMRQLSLLLDTAYADISLWTEIVLNLHDYQCHGPDPDIALSRYRSSEEAAYDVIRIAKKIVKVVEATRSRLKLEGLQAALEQLEKKLEVFGAELKG